MPWRNNRTPDRETRLALPSSDVALLGLFKDSSVRESSPYRGTRPLGLACPRSPGSTYPKIEPTPHNRSSCFQYSIHVCHLPILNSTGSYKVCGNYDKMNSVIAVNKHWRVPDVVALSVALDIGDLEKHIIILIPRLFSLFAMNKLISLCNTQLGLLFCDFSYEISWSCGNIQASFLCSLFCHQNGYYFLKRHWNAGLQIQFQASVNALIFIL
ncbi:hypothetical protein KFK09_021360 [Dendrobium nobile]|uniref:Uncharacterized protein n=1 Tax=Dendrobium nobile TaxID=94219 RepID=A0A8T3AP22_DENNO|nr:hypothetical protein KFK09_021360 [Dendrobium nobile]